MRIMPIQVHMLHLAGEPLPVESPPRSPEIRAQRILAAKEALIRVTGQDFGYDVSRWHQYLASAQAPDEIRSDYTWNDWHEQFEDWRPNPEWRLAVEQAERLALTSPNCPQCGSFVSLRRISHEPQGAREEMWLCTICKMRFPISSLKDRREPDENT